MFVTTRSRSPSPSISPDVELDGDVDLAIANGRVNLGPPDPEAEAVPPWDRLAERNLLFLNSRTVPSTVPRTVARQGQYDFLERDIFLDNVRDISAIKKALAKALRVARQRGQAVAIGHP